MHRIEPSHSSFGRVREMQLTPTPVESRNLRNRHGSDNRETDPLLETEPSELESPPPAPPSAPPIHHPSPSGSVESTLTFSSNSTSPDGTPAGDAKDGNNESSEIDLLVSCLTAVGNCLISGERNFIGDRSFQKCRGTLVVLICICVVCTFFAGAHLAPRGIRSLYSASNTVTQFFTPNRAELPVLAAVCTHHRSGTVLFQAIGEKLCEEFLVDYERVEQPFRLDAPALTETLLYQHYFNASEKLVVGMHGFGESCPKGEILGDYCTFFDWRCWLSSCNITIQSLDRTIPVAHIVRNPVEVLVSAYLYHQQDPPPEEWLAEPKPEALTILPEVLQVEFHSVPYFKVLQDLPPDLGLLVEYTVEMEDLFRMARNYRDLASFNYAMNMKFEDVKKHYSPSMESILTHLGLIEKFGEDDVMDIASKLDLNKMTTKIRNAYQIDMHVTEGKHNKKSLRKALYNNKEMRSVLEAIATELEYPDPFGIKS